MAPVDAHDVEGRRSRRACCARERADRRARRPLPGRRHEADHTEAEHRPVRVQADGDERSHRPERGQRGEPDGHEPGEQGAQHHGAERPEEPVPQRHGRAAPRARTTSGLCRLRRMRRLITCPAMSRAATPAMPPKTPSAIASGRSVASAVATTLADWT